MSGDEWWMCGLRVWYVVVYTRGWLVFVSWRSAFVCHFGWCTDLPSAPSSLSLLKQSHTLNGKKRKKNELLKLAMAVIKRQSFHRDDTSGDTLRSFNF
jgi:hypothetical protein